MTKKSRLTLVLLVLAANGVAQGAALTPEHEEVWDGPGASRALMPEHEEVWDGPGASRALMPEHEEVWDGPAQTSPPAAGPAGARDP